MTAEEYNNNIEALKAGLLDNKFDPSDIVIANKLGIGNIVKTVFGSFAQNNPSNQQPVNVAGVNQQVVN